MILLHVRDRVQQPPRPQHERVLGVQCRGDDPRLVLPGLEVRIGEADEDLGQLAPGEEVGEEFHRVGAEGGDVLVAARDYGCWGCCGGGGGGGRGGGGRLGFGRCGFEWSGGLRRRGCGW